MSKTQAMKHLKSKREHLTPQQYRTFKGQVLSGNIQGAMIGLNKIINRAG